MSPLRPIRLSTRPAAPEGTGRDGTDGTRGRGGQRGARGQGARSSRPRQRATGPAQLSPGREGGRRGRVSGEKRAHAHPSPSGSCLLHQASLAPLPASPSSSHSLAVAPPPPGPHVTQDSSRHVTRERPRWGGIGSLLPSLRKRNTGRACAMGGRSGHSPSDRYCAFCSGIGGSCPEAYSPFFSSHSSLAYGP